MQNSDAFMKNGTEEKNLQENQAELCPTSYSQLARKPTDATCYPFNGQGYIKYLKLTFAAYSLSLVSLCMAPAYSPWLTRIPIMMSTFYHFSPCSKKWSPSSSFHPVCDRFTHWTRILMDDNCSIWSCFLRYTTVLKEDFNIFTKEIAMQKFQITQHDVLDWGGRNVSSDVFQIIPYILVLYTGCPGNEALLSSSYAPRLDPLHTHCWDSIKLRPYMKAECGLIRSTNKTEW